SLAAVTIAFILEPMVALLMRLRFPRSLASFVVCTLALLLVYLIGIGAYTQAAGLADDLPKYSQKISEVVGEVQQRVDDMEQKTYQLLVPPRQRRSNQPPPPPPDTTRKKGRKNEPPGTVLPAP